MRWVLVLVAVACSGPQSKKGAPFDPPKPTLRLPRHFTPAAYTATLAIDPAQPGFTGHIEIAGKLDRPASVIWLNARELTVTRATANGKPVKVTLHDELLELRAPFAEGPVSLVIDYEGKIATTGVRGVFRNEHASTPYVYTYFEPIHARTAFPCIDEPDRKTPWTLTIEAPRDNIAVSNAPVQATTKLDDGRTRTTFVETKPLPSYLVAFGVGPFDVVEAGASKAGVPLRLIVPRGEAARTKYAAGAFARIVDILQAYFEVTFPYPKLDVLVAPTMANGAMEHAGLITSDAVNILVDDNASWRERHNVIVTIGHEASHQWFGDLVTPPWFDDVWLKEGFATWMESKVTTAFDPSWHDERALVSRRNGAFAVDAQASARVVRQKLERPDQIQGTFDAISYTKGAAIIAVFERYVGEEVFRRALRDYFLKHVHGVAAFDDFVASIEKSTGKPLAAAFSTYLEQPGVPVLDAKLVCDGVPRLVVNQRRYLVAGNTAPTAMPWHIPVCVAFDKAGQRAEACTLVETEHATVPLPSCPSWWMMNAGGTGYYYTAITAADVATLRDRAWPLLSHGERRAVFEDVRGQVLLGKLPAGLLMSFVPKLVEAGDRHSVGDALGDRWASDVDGGGHGLPAQLEVAITPDIAPALAAWVRKQYGPLAQARGFEPAANDGIDEEATRRTLIRTLGAVGDPEITKRAVALAARYRELPESTRALVLPIAANADPKVADRLRADVLVETDRALRLSLLQALAAIEDPARISTLDVMLDPKLTGEDVMFGLLRGGQTTGATRQVSTWLRANIKALLAKFPDDEGSLGFFLGYGIFTCDAKQRDETVAVLQTTFAKVPHTEKVLQQQTERIDRCITERALVAPSLREWLRTAR